MSIEAMKQALETLEHLRSHDKRNLYGLDEDITALRTAIEQAEKPVECMCGICNLGKRQWVGLTDEEKRQIALDDPIDWVAAIEAKLKEKNR